MLVDYLVARNSQWCHDAPLGGFSIVLSHIHDDILIGVELPDALAVDLKCQLLPVGVVPHIGA